MFALAAPPGPVLLVVICIGTTAAGTHRPYFLRRFLIELLPVVVMPPGADRHSNPPGYRGPVFQGSNRLDLVPFYYYITPVISGSLSL